MAEAMLWKALKARQLGGHKFVRQYPVGLYIADFAHRSSRLLLEIDGSQHVASERDVTRDMYLTGQGYDVLRLWSATVLGDTACACDTILDVIENRPCCIIETADLRFRPRAQMPSPPRQSGAPLP